MNCFRNGNCSPRRQFGFSDFSLAEEIFGSIIG